MTRVMMALLSVAVFGGCITTQFSSHSKRVDAYLLKNPAVSGEIKEALRDARVVKGMNEEQVLLSWGKPDNKKSFSTGASKNESIWYYYDNSKDDMSGSVLFKMDVPERRVNFGAGGLVYEWKIYDEEIETSRSTALTRTLPSKILPAQKGFNPDGRPVLRAGEFKNWPFVTLTSIVGMGENGAAVLNGSIVGVGEDVDGVRVLAVGSNGVKLEYKGQIGILKKGESTL